MASLPRPPPQPKRREASPVGRGDSGPRCTGRGSPPRRPHKLCRVTPSPGSCRRGRRQGAREAWRGVEFPLVLVWGCRPLRHHARTESLALDRTAATPHPAGSVPKERWEVQDEARTTAEESPAGPERCWLRAQLGPWFPGRGRLGSEGAFPKSFRNRSRSALGGSRVRSSPLVTSPPVGGGGSERVRVGGAVFQKSLFTSLLSVALLRHAALCSPPAAPGGASPFLGKAKKGEAPPGGLKSVQ